MAKQLLEYLVIYPCMYVCYIPYFELSVSVCVCILAPSAPIVSAVVNGSESIYVSWSVQDDGGNVKLLYFLSQWSDHYDTGLLLLTNSVDRWHLADHLMPNTTYWFSVVAHSDTGYSAEGLSRRVTTRACK